MSDTTTTEPVSLSRLRHGDGFTFRGTQYVVLEHARSRTTIGTVGDGKIGIYKLGMAAKVVRTGRDDAGYRLALAVWRPPITLEEGDTVRVVTNDRTIGRRIAGIESIVIRVNTKTVSLANGWRISPSMVEKI